MKSRHLKGRSCVLPGIILGIMLTSLSAGAITQTTAPNTTPDKIYVTDGHVRHDVGRLHNNATNWGLIGSMPSVPTNYSHAPSGHWPVVGGTDYLWAAGLWIGGILNGEAVVSTGSYSSELYPSEAPADSIYATFMGDVGGNRFPWPDADDDGDGLEDEDPLNGLDDDGDGLVDEDFAAISHQHFRCVYRDDTPLAQENNPDHVPMGLSITQESLQWALAKINNAIGYEFTITNVGDSTVENMYLGMFSDFDIENADDDVAGFWEGLVAASNGLEYPVAMAYMRDAATVDPVVGFQAWVLLGHTTDPAGVDAPAQVGVNAYRDWSGNLSYELGGDPTNDAERYEVMSVETRDGPSLRPGDHRILTSSGPFTSLAPGESLKYQVALVSAINLDWLRINAAEIVACFQGAVYDRDGQPEQVHWIPPGEEPVAASTGSMLSRMIPQGLQIDIESNVSVAEGLTLVRRASAGLAQRTWGGDALIVSGHFTNRMRYTVVDTDPGRGLRTYDLVLEKDGASLVLAQLETGIPDLRMPVLEARPNPFNPRLEVRFVTPQDGNVRLQAFDVRGYLVRTLLDESRLAGEGAVVWDGVDDGGRALASGVYRLKMEAGGQLVEKRVTLVR